jgi:ssDNA-binding Zn-finger/Zn-ribbon topoisomerase 1
MDGSLLMANKKKPQWDGRSRIPTQQYKDNYNEIFKKEKKITKNNSKPNDSVEKPGVSSSLQINAEIVNGTCPHCRHETVLVSVWTNSLYRCMTCGFDVKQMVNGKISYIPHVTDAKKFKYGMKIDNPNG